MLTGPMIRGAMEVSPPLSRASFPAADHLWRLASQPAAGRNTDEPFVDMVVRGQGEVTLVELARRCSRERPSTMMPGFPGRATAAQQHNLDRHVEPLDALPIPAFDLTDFDAYEKLCGVRKLAYATSVGCPYACNYCTDMVFYKRRFNALSAERVVSELTDLVTRYRIEEVALLDSNFPVELARALEIARGILASGVKFRWTFQASTDFLCRMSEEEVRSAGRERRIAHGLRHGIDFRDGAEADEQAPPARQRDVRNRAQGESRRHPRHVQSDLRLSR